jgi:hypothetical protein
VDQTRRFEFERQYWLYSAVSALNYPRINELRKWLLDRSDAIRAFVLRPALVTAATAGMVAMAFTVGRGLCGQRLCELCRHETGAE